MRQRTRSTLLVSSTFGLLLSVVLGSQVTTVSHQPAPVAAPPAATSTHQVMTPEPKEPHSTHPGTVYPPANLTTCAHTVGSVRIYYADFPVRTKADPFGKEGRHSDGPALVNMDMAPAEMVKQNTVDQAIISFWTRLCNDPAFAAKTAASYDPKGGNPNAVLTDSEWSGALDFIRSQGEWSYAKGARLVYETAPKHSWTDYMISLPGHPPLVGYDNYPHGASWLLKVPNAGKPSSHENFRLACGGQWVGPKSRIPRAYNN